MTIRYSCVQCGSVLKIKDDRAGKDGHCPKCKASFIVPFPEAATSEPAVEEVAVASKAAAAESPAPRKAAVVAAPPAADDADFDPVAFLMTEGAGKPDKSAPKRAAAEAADQPDMRVGKGAAPAAYTASDEPDERVGGRRKPAAAADDDSAAEMMKRKPKRPAPPSAAQTADEMLRVNASNNAKELLTKTMEESRIRAAQMPEERRAPGIDYKATAKELLLRFAPAVLGTVGLIVGAYWFGNFMSGGGPDLPNLGSVSGTVTKAGQPLAGAHVIFTPVDVQAGAATAFSDENGYYELKYTEGVDGAVVGKNRVEVSLVGPDGREQVPAKTTYGLGSNVIETVEDRSQTIDIQIP